jgi:hypothetical protein
MTTADALAKDILYAKALGWVRPVCFALALVVAGAVFGFCAHPRPEPILAALRDTIRLTDSVVRVQTETVTVYRLRVDTVKARSDALDQQVTIRDDSTVALPDTVAVIPPLVVADVTALRRTVTTQDTLIHWLYARDTTRQWQLATRDRMIRELSQRHPLACGRRCGFVLGAASALLVVKAAR